MSSSTETLRQTPLHALHLERGARMVPFAGYSMPVQYPAGVMAEHLHTRAAAGLFDISHMGQLRLLGPDAGAALESLIPVDVIHLPIGKQRYGLLLNDAGGIIDDLMFVNRDFQHGGDLFVIVNGACRAADLAHIEARMPDACWRPESAAACWCETSAHSRALTTACELPSVLRSRRNSG